MYDSSSRVYKLWLAPALFWKSGAKVLLFGDMSDAQSCAASKHTKKHLRKRGAWKIKSIQEVGKRSKLFVCWYQKKAPPRTDFRSDGLNDTHKSPCKKRDVPVIRFAEECSVLLLLFFEQKLILSHCCLIFN